MSEMHKHNMNNKQLPVFFDWQACFNAGVEQVGAKAWNLGRLAYYGFDGAEGGVIPVSVYQDFLKRNQLLEELRELSEQVTLDCMGNEQTKLRIESLHARILAASFSLEFVDALNESLREQNLLNVPLAVRSSATCEDSETASFAGIHESFLNVRGMENLLIAVKQCFASLWSLRAIAYRRKMGISDSRVQAAVIVMALIEADASGVAFSCDPSSGREDVCLINANFGLGESVVDGIVEADTYIVDRAWFHCQSENIGEKQSMTVVHSNGGTRIQKTANASRKVLNTEQLYRLGILIERVVNCLGHFDTHLDIEWALLNDRFYILQSRPVTVLPRYTEEGIRDQADIWSNANFRDAVPMVISFLQRDTMMHALNRIILSPFKELGYKLKPGISIAKYIRGRAYFNTALYQWLAYDAIGLKPSDLNLFLGGHQPDIQVPAGSPFKGKRGIRRIITLLRNMRLVSSYQKQQARFYADVDDIVSRLQAIDLTTLSDQSFIQAMERLEHDSMRFNDRYMTLCGAVGSYGVALNLLSPSFGDEALSIVNALVAGRGNLPSAEQGYQMLALAEVARSDKSAREYLLQIATLDISTDEKGEDWRKDTQALINRWRDLDETSPFMQQFNSYLQQYGFRGTYELDCSQPRWHEDPSYLLLNVAKSLNSADIGKHRQRQQQTYDKAMARLKEKISFFKRHFVLNLIKQAVKGAETRETAKSYVVKMIAQVRRLYLEAGRRLFDKALILQREDVFFCSMAELLSIFNGYWSGDTLSLIISERKALMQEWQADVPPDVMVNGEKVYAKAAVSSDGHSFQGIGVSAGFVEGNATLILNPDQGARLKPGDIMVAPSTDPAWTPLFINAGGIVLETGGYTSHGSIVAREYGIPAVVNLPGILQNIKSGQRISVDADRGKVSLHKAKSE